MRNFEITLREVLVSIVIILLMIGGGFFISSSIHNKVSEDNEKYFKALKVDNDSNLFDYAINTNVGNILSYGTFKANKPVSDKLLKGKYFSIIKIEEHYTMHTRTVTYSCGKTTCTRTETYWTWDEVGRDYFNTKTFNYLGRNFDYKIIDFNNYSYTDTIQPDTFVDVRYVFYIIPIEFKGSLFSKTKDKTITQNNLYEGQTIKGLITEKESEADTDVIGFWAIWIILIVIIVIIFIAAENRFINNKKYY